MQQRIIGALKARNIAAMATTRLPGWAGVSVTMSVTDLERFLDLVVPRPISGDDETALRIVGRPADLTVTDEPWQYELVPTVQDVGFQFRAVVNIPAQDVDEVLARLRGSPSTPA